MEENFIDRTDKKNEKKPMFKLLVLQNLGIYWNSKEKLFLAESEKYITVDKLTKMILKKSQVGEGASKSNWNT